MVDKYFIEKAREYYKEIYKPYGYRIYTPMPETKNLGLPVTVGCSYNKCLYCGLNKKIKFQIISLEIIEDSLQKLQFIHKDDRKNTEKILLLGGNPFVLKTDYLVEISKLIMKYFPKTKYISSFARVEDILRKTEEELILLKEYKYDNLSLGVESGLDIALKFQKKGSTAKENLIAMKKLESLGINYSAYIILGFGGIKYSKENAMETSKLLNQVHPFELIVVNLVYFPNAPLLEKVKGKIFRRLTLLESLKEEYLLLSNLEMKAIIFNATHKNNTIPIKGNLPEHKDMMLEKIKKNIIRIEEEKNKTINKKILNL